MNLRILFIISLFALFTGCQTKNSLTALIPATRGHVAKIEAEQKKFDHEQSESIEEIAEIIDEMQDTPQSANLHMEAHHQAAKAKERAEVAQNSNEQFQKGPDIGAFMNAFSGLLSGDPTALINIVLAFLGITGVGYGAVKRKQANKAREQRQELAFMNPKKAKKKLRDDPNYK